VPFQRSTPSYFPRKLSVFEIVAVDARKARPAGGCRRVLKSMIDSGDRRYGAACFSMARPMLMMMSAITPSPTQRSFRHRPCIGSGRDVPPLAHADASLASVRHFWPLRNSASSALVCARGSWSTVGNADALDALGFRCCLVLGGVECGIGCTCAADAPALLDASRWRQSAVRIARTPIIDLVVDHDLSSASCSFTILPNSFGLRPCLCE